MTDFIINGIFWVLALYGLIEIIKIIYNFFTYPKVEIERSTYNYSGKKSRK